MPPEAPRLSQQAVMRACATFEAQLGKRSIG